MAIAQRGHAGLQVSQPESLLSFLHLLFETEEAFKLFLQLMVIQDCQTSQGADSSLTDQVNLSTLESCRNIWGHSSTKTMKIQSLQAPLQKKKVFLLPQYRLNMRKGAESGSKTRRDYGVQLLTCWKTDGSMNPQATQTKS